MPEQPATAAAPALAEAPESGWPPRWRDLIAGLYLAGLLLPEAVAYAGLARLPVVHALSAMLVGLAVCAQALVALVLLSIFRGTLVMSSCDAPVAWHFPGQSRSA